MVDLRYLLRVFSSFSIHKFRSAVHKAHSVSGKPRLFIAVDILWCALRYGGGYYDYCTFAFYNLNGRERDTFMTRLRSKRINTALNDPKYQHFFQNKGEFNQVFSSYLRRDYLAIDGAEQNDVRRFFHSHPVFFAKPVSGECGIGCMLVRRRDFPDDGACEAFLRGNGCTLLEEPIIQHHAMRSVYPHAVNCLRIMTLIDDGGTPRCIYATQKFGMNGRVVDNSALRSPVDLETGRILFPAVSGATGEVFTEHPESHVKMQGFQVPHFSEAVELCLQAAAVIPQIRYVGWDVAITDAGPVIVEGNTSCAYDFWQLPPHTPNKTGVMPIFRRYAPSIF